MECSLKSLWSLVDARPLWWMVGCLLGLPSFADTTLPPSHCQHILVASLEALTQPLWRVCKCWKPCSIISVCPPQGITQKIVSPTP